MPGVSLVVVQGDQILLSKAYGYADFENKKPMTTRSAVMLGSTMKAITALAVMQLVEQDKLDLDAPVRRYLPFFAGRPRAARVTLRHLLTHTSGVQPGPDADPNQPGPLAKDVRAGVKGMTFPGEPGTRFEYSSFSYSVAGLVVERASGTPFERFVRQHLFVPLKPRRAQVGWRRTAHTSTA